MRKLSSRQKFGFVLANVFAIVGFFVLFGTAGTIDRLPAEQLPTWQMILQLFIGTVILGIGAFGLNRIYAGGEWEWR